MASIVSSGIVTSGPGIASAEEIRTAFAENSQALTWLAEFLTGDEMVASACVVDAGTLTEHDYKIGQEWYWTWPRDATIQSALDVQRARIAQLSPVYERGGCIHGKHEPLPQDMIEFVANESEAIRVQVDVLCRFVLILCGVERRTSDEAALLLEISKHAVEAAYCAALQLLEVIWCEVLLEDGFAAAAN